MNGWKEIDGERVPRRRGATTVQRNLVALLDGSSGVYTRVYLSVHSSAEENCTPATRNPFSLPSRKGCSPAFVRSERDVVQNTGWPESVWPNHAGTLCADLSSARVVIQF